MNNHQIRTLVLNESFIYQLVEVLFQREIRSLSASGKPPPVVRPGAAENTNSRYRRQGNYHQSLLFLCPCLMKFKNGDTFVLLMKGIEFKGLLLFKKSEVRI